MGLINIAIVSEDKEYSSALAWAMVRNTKGIEIWVYDDPDLVDVDVKFDVLLTDMTLSSSLAGSMVVAYLTEDRSGKRNGIEESEEKTTVIYKYGNVNDIIRRLFEICGYDPDGVIQGHAEGAGEYEKELYCFAAERGGSGCSLAGRSFAEDLGKYYGRKVLFFSLDQFPDPAHSSGTSCISRSDGLHQTDSSRQNDPFSEGDDHGEDENGVSEKRKTLKQYLYHLLKNYRDDPGWDADLMHYLQRDENNVFFFRQDNGLNPLLELNECQFDAFLKTVMEHGAHDTIVTDCGSQVTMQMIRAMEMSRRVFLVKDDRPENIGWRNCVGRLTDDEVRAKIVLLPPDIAGDADWIINEQWRLKK